MNFVEWGYKYHIYVGLYFLPFPDLLPLPTALFR